MSNVEKNIQMGVAYYQAMREKNVESVADLFDENVELVGPLANLTGKQVFVQAASKYAAAVQDLTIREKFGMHNQVMIVYDVKFADPFGNVRTASLLTMKDMRIIRIELFFDASAFRR